MRRSKLSALARSITLLASVGAPCLAHSADLLPPLPPEPLPPPVEIGGGWYLRGDVGVGASDLGAITSNPAGAAVLTGYRIDQKSIDDTYFAGGGFGYQFSSFFHADITAEYRGGGHIAFLERYDGGGGKDGLDSYKANLSSVVTMANGYVDLGTWYGVTPYVGGGVGAAFHRVGGFSDFGAGTAAGGYGISGGKQSTSFAWSAQAGLAYNVTQNVKLELGYRYMNLGHVKLGTISCYGGCESTSFAVKDITSHDVKLGMRWMLGGYSPPIVADYQPMPGPLVRKY